MGHLLHMPAHVFLRTGHYDQCIASSLAALANDAHLQTQCLVPYFPGHNKALLVMCALYKGDMGVALSHSRPVATLTAQEVRGMSSMYAVPQVVIDEPCPHCVHALCVL